MKSIVIFLSLIISSFSVFAQFEVKTNNRPDGITIKYINPIPVAIADDYEAGLSLYKNTANNVFTIAITVLFKSSVPTELNGNLLIQTTGNNGISLVPIMNKLINMDGREVATSMYSLTIRDIKELSNHQIKMLTFRVNDEIIALHLTKNKDLLIKEFSLLHDIDKTNRNDNSGLARDSNDINYDELYKNMKRAGFKSDPAYSNNLFNKTETTTVDFDSTNLDSVDVYDNPESSNSANPNEERPFFILGFIVVLLLIVFYIILNKKPSEVIEDVQTKTYKSPSGELNNIGQNNRSKEHIIISDSSIKQNSKTVIETNKVKPVVVNNNIREEESGVFEIKKIGYKPSLRFKQAEPYSYPVVKMPKEDCFVKFPKLGRTNKLGYTEKSFYNQLNKYFSSDFKVYNDRHILHRNNYTAYEPDFLLINEKNEKNIFIDIEIDEPYDGISRVPTHELNRDIYRDLFFTNRGYIVIRFTEKQIFEEAKECCIYISNVIKSIDPNYKNNELNYSSKITIHNQWDSLQSKKWALEKFREKYLKIESFKQNQFNFNEIEIVSSELDDIVESLIDDDKPSNVNIDDNKPLKNNQFHPRDKRIAFDQANHRYYIDNNPDTISVSQLIDKFFPEFDPIGAALNLNPNHKYYNYPVEDIIDIWEKDGIEAAKLGTLLHQQIEYYYKSMPFDASSLEFKYFLDFKERFSGMLPHRTEWRIFNEDYLIAGTIDMIYKREDGSYYLFDWKRSKKVVDNKGNLKLSDPAHFYTKYAYGGLSHLTDDSYYKYALQQNIYRHILETKYGFAVSSMNLLILHPEYETYHWVKLPKMQDEVNYMLETLKIIS